MWEFPRPWDLWWEDPLPTTCAPMYSTQWWRFYSAQVLANREK